MPERRYAIQRLHNSDTVEYVVGHMSSNKAYRYAAERQGDADGRLLAEFQQRFRAYRTAWRANPDHAIRNRLHDQYYRTTGNPPLSVDIETVATCDLACSFCYRQWITTPDKMIRDDLYYRLIDQCAELGVPSVKLNWRGEPILHPKLPQYVDYAKRAGILETVVNTNAVTLTEQKARALIEAGLDQVIYSFDGGTKATYEKMRVGRFEENTFEPVYENIRRLARLRDEMGSPFPRTRIQMILTADTAGEQEEFFKLFSDCVDDVSVKAYTERGGGIPDLTPEARDRVLAFLQQQGLPERTPHWRDMHGNLFVSVGRLACEQIYQRLMVGYDGTVSMCCYDWGSEYPIGYADSRAFDEAPRDYAAVMKKVEKKAKGFELLQNVKMPRRYVDPPKQVQSLREIWDGQVVNHVRREHVEGRLENIAFCKGCEFKETYQWLKVPDVVVAGV